MFYGTGWKYWQLWGYVVPVLKLQELHLLLVNLTNIKDRFPLISSFLLIFYFLCNTS